MPGVGNIPIIVSICQNRRLSNSKIQQPVSPFCARETIFPQKMHNQGKSSSAEKTFSQLLDDFIHCSSRTTKIDRFDVKIPTLIIWVFFVGQKQFVAVEWKRQLDPLLQVRNPHKGGPDFGKMPVV